MPPASPRTHRLVDAQQLLDGSLGLLVRVLAEVVEADAPSRSTRWIARQYRLSNDRQMAKSWSMTTGQPTPSSAAARAHVVKVGLEPELRRVHAHHDEAGSPRTSRPTAGGTAGSAAS